MKKILIIEDDKTLLENTCFFLKRNNYIVESAQNGAEGIQKAINQLPDLIICDIAMPGMNGYKVFNTLNKIPTTAGIPFIFLTAKAEKEEIRIGMQLGADDYLTKPFEYEELLTTISIRIKKYETIILSHEEKYKALIENPIIGVFIYHGKKFVFANQRLSEILGYSNKELMGINMVNIVLKQDRGLFTDKIRKCFDGLQSFVHIQFKALRKDKKIAKLELYGKLTKIKEKDCLIGNIKDNSKIKEENNDEMLLKNVNNDELQEVVTMFTENNDLRVASEYYTDKLTKRQIEILKYISDGLKSNEIAKLLFISQRTVEWHRNNLLEKTNSINTAELIKYAIKRGIIKI